MTPAEEHLSRDERRRRSEAAILAAARELFAEQGFERTTIRGVAARVGVDPALVMQHFGSKAALFAAASSWSGEHQRILTATTDRMPSAALQDLLEQFEDPEQREPMIALLRNSLTHPEAARIVKDELMCDRSAVVARVCEGEDAELRAGLFGACMFGLGVSRYLLQLEPLASASPADVQRLMEPVLALLLRDPATSAAPCSHEDDAAPAAPAD